METQHNRSLKKLVSDQGGEFLNSHFQQLANKCGFVHSFSPAYTPKHNGFAERANRTILEKTRCILNATNLPNSYWAETVSTATLLSNSVPTPSRHNHSPHTLWTGLPLRIKKKILISRHVSFNESVFPQLKHQSNDQLPLSLPWEALDKSLPEHQPLPNLTPDTQELVDEPQVSVNQDKSTMVDETRLADDAAPACPDSEPNRQPIRIKVIGPRHPTLVSSTINPDNILSYPRQAGALLTTLDDTPNTYSKAISSPSKEVWLEAINKELLSMEKLNGFTQTPGVDFDKTYSPTGRLNSLHTLIAFSASNGLLFHQIDVKSAFLNAPLAESVYLGIPQGLRSNKQKYCLRLKKVIYGLRQAPLAWYECLKGWLSTTGFKSCTLDPCVFYCRTGSPLWLYVHVDDIAIFGREVESFKCQIAAEFDMKDIGPADLMLGVKITQGDEGITLDQQHFSESLLELYGMRSRKLTSTPLIPNCHLGPATTDKVDKFKALGINYCRAIGSINYLSTATCPDLSFAVSTLSQFLENPGINHWHRFLHVLRYLNGSQDVGLSYGRKGRPGFVAYSDADWGNCLLTRRSVTGYLPCFNQCLVVWKTREQPTASLSIAEAKYKSLCDLTSELLWLSQWCQEAEPALFDLPIPIHEDNQACINTANGNSNVNAKRMKHVDIQLHFVKECIKLDKIRLVYTPTVDMLADFLTKSVPKALLTQALAALGLSSLGVRRGAKNQL
ncbi:hypothetical protein O181_038466 [Austropuccinia psidii MF-1]|uniref:Integrase catalytic domain-containing protein n=1 Tax=Austropuccinia psidii MF-1 TaxID=1389203 RepID=A0A9Q3D814_9BASI|nr:hypothetical protein [Austropuccinia psidii MF-1]